MARANKAKAPVSRRISTSKHTRTIKKQQLENATRRRRAIAENDAENSSSTESSPPAEEIHQNDRSRNMTPSSTLLDTSTIKYELNLAAFLDKKAMGTRIKHPIIGEFKLQTYLADIIKIIAQRAEKDTELIKWDDGRAELRHKGLKKAADYAKNDVFDDGDWAEVERAVKTWMEQKHQDIRVDLHLHFKTTVQAAQPKETEPPVVVNVDENGATKQVNMHTFLV